MKTFKRTSTLSVAMKEEFPPQTLDGIHEFIRQLVKESGAEGVVIGLSGGIDSALVSRLCVDVLGGDRVLNVFMPSSSSPAEDHDLTRRYSEMIGSEYRTVPIQAMVDAFRSVLVTDDRLELGNIMARCRMTVLYHMAKSENRLVMGTGNRSELLMGYFTKHGDGACDALPIGNLYKTQVRQLSIHLGIPDYIVDRVPSAGLWEGQSDEQEMGISYENLDLILKGINDDTPPEETASLLDIPLEKVIGIEARVAANRHKRHAPPLPNP